MTSLTAPSLQLSLSLLMMPTQMMTSMVLLIRLFLYQRLMMMLLGSRLLKLKDQQPLLKLDRLTHLMSFLTLNQTVTSFSRSPQAILESPPFTDLRQATIQ